MSGFRFTDDGTVSDVVFGANSLPRRARHETADGDVTPFTLQTINGTPRLTLDGDIFAGTINADLLAIGATPAIGLVPDGHFEERCALAGRRAGADICKLVLARRLRHSRASAPAASGAAIADHDGRGVWRKSKLPRPARASARRAAICDALLGVSPHRRRAGVGAHRHRMARRRGILFARISPRCKPRGRRSW